MERRQVLNLELLEARRIKSDLKLCFKIINGLCDFGIDAFFKFAPQTSVTTGHNKKLIKSICSNNWQLNYFSSRIVNIWNSLPPELVMLNLWTFLQQNIKNMTCQCSARAVGPRCFI